MVNVRLESTVAREGALDNLSPALCAGNANVAELAATTTLCSARFCSGRLRGRASDGTSEPRAERGAKFVERAFARN
jgi:hypothetical protein